MRQSVVVLMLAGAIGACGDDLGSEPGVGALRVTMATTGADLDLDGYGLTVDGTAQPGLGLNETVVVLGLSAGEHDIGLTGVAENCGLDGPADRAVNVGDGDTTLVTYTVTCRATGLKIAASTTGPDRDPDGYEVSIDGKAPAALGALDSRTVTRLSPGSHTVTLTGVAANCTVTADNPRAVVVTLGEVLDVPFTVACTAVTGFLAVSAVTTGADLDDLYLIQVAGRDPQGLPSNGTVVLSGLAPGSMLIGLDNVSGNCTLVGDNPRTVSIPLGDTARTTFEAGCGAATAIIEVVTATSGSDYDPDAYALRMDPGDSYPIGVNASAAYVTLAAGEHVLTLEDVASHCTVAGPNPRTVSVSIGGTTRDTARTRFEVTCAKTWAMAFAHGYAYSGQVPAIRVASADGLVQGTLGLGVAPAWSPDGTQVAYVNFGCDYDDYYYTYYCFRNGLVVAGTSGSGVDTLTWDGNDADPAWRPDGTQIAFTRGSVLHLVNPDGSGVTPLPGAGSVSHPAWSPTGSALVFTCEVDGGNLDICLVNADGTGLTRLTSDTARDARPAWSPDGSRIAFVTTRFTGTELAVMGVDGSAVTRLAAGTQALEPAWSTDGTKILYTRLTCDIYSGCTVLGLSVMNADGTGQTPITSGRDLGVAWRP